MISVCQHLAPVFKWSIWMEGNLGLGRAVHSFTLAVQITVKMAPWSPFTAYPKDFVGVPWRGVCFLSLNLNQEKAKFNYSICLIRMCKRRMKTTQGGKPSQADGQRNWILKASFSHWRLYTWCLPLYILHPDCFYSFVLMVFPFLVEPVWVEIHNCPKPRILTKQAFL